MQNTYRDMSFGDYWRTYFPDLVEAFPAGARSCILDKLHGAFVEQQYAGREVVQRLGEVYEGAITIDQYFSWAISDEDDDGAEHMIAHIAAGEYVDGSRTETLRVLANIDYSPAFAAQVKCAVEDGVLTHEEMVEVLSCSLRNAPLPKVRERPDGVPSLPFRRVMTSGACREHAHAS